LSSPERAPDKARCGREKERGAGAGLFSVLHDGCSMLNNTQKVCAKQNLMTSSYFVTSPYHLSQELNLVATIAQSSIPG